MKTADKMQVCVRHTGTQTRLNCAQCGRAMCARCSRQTPVSIKCVDCVGAAVPSALRFNVLDLGLFLLIGGVIGTGVGIGVAYLIDAFVFANFPLAAFVARTATGLTLGLCFAFTYSVTLLIFNRKANAQPRILTRIAFGSVALSVIVFALAILYLRGHSGSFLFSILVSFNTIAGLAIGVFFSLRLLRRR